MILFGGAPAGRRDPSNALYYASMSELSGSNGMSRMAMWHRGMASGTPPRPRYGHTATRVGLSSVAYYGGVCSNGELLGDIAVLDTETFVWSVITSFIGKEPAPRFGHQTVCVGAAGVENDLDAATLIVFGGSCRSAKDDSNDSKAMKKFKRTKRREGHVVYSHEIYSFDLVKRCWMGIKTGVTHPSARYDATLTASEEFGSANLMGSAEPAACVLTGAALPASVERDGGRYALLYGGFNSMSVNSDVWALSLEWEGSHTDQGEFETRGDNFTSLVQEFQGDGSHRQRSHQFLKHLNPVMLHSASTPTLHNNPSNTTLASSASTVRFDDRTKAEKSRQGGAGAEIDLVDLASNENRLLEIVAALGVDHKSIEKALMNAKKGKILASKDAAAEKIERLKLDEIIRELKVRSESRVIIDARCS